MTRKKMGYELLARNEIRKVATRNTCHGDDKRRLKRPAMSGQSKDQDDFTLAAN